MVPGKKAGMTWYHMQHVCSKEKYFTWHLCSEFSGLKLHQISNFPGLCPGPSWGSLQRSPNTLAGGDAAPLPKNPTSRYRASGFGPSGRSLIRPPPSTRPLKIWWLRPCSHDFLGGLAAFIFTAGSRLAAIFTARLQLRGSSQK